MNFFGILIIGIIIGFILGIYIGIHCTWRIVTKAENYQLKKKIKYYVKIKKKI